MRLLIPFKILLVVLATCFAMVWIVFFNLFNRPITSYKVVIWWSRLLYSLAGVKVESQGLDKVPKGSYLVMSNHSSHLDGPGLLMTLPHPIYFVIKKELTKIPIWGTAAKRVGFIVIDRANTAEAKKTLAEAEAVIHRGRHVLFFPEGTRARDHRLHRFKKGGFHMAVGAQVPILPLAVNGSRKLLPKGTHLPKPGVVHIVVGDPIPTSGLTRDDIPALAEKTRAAIRELRRLDPDFVDDD